MKKQGYILVISLMMISLCVVLVTSLADRSTIFLPFTRTYQDRQQAYMLALSGIQIAKSQLAVGPKKEQDKKEQPAHGPATPQNKEKEYVLALLRKLFPTLNQWQTFTLSKENDGVDGTIKLCISCEDGKLDFNAFASLYTDEKNNDKSNAATKKVIQELITLVERNVKSSNMLQALGALLKKRGYPLDDPTELLTLKEFAPFKNHIFYEPLEQKKDKQEKQPLYLTDLFTVWTGKKTIEPWFFSESMMTLLGLTRSPDTKKFAEMLKNFTITPQWTSAWLSKLPFSQREGTSLPKDITQIFSKKCEPTVFSVLIHATFGQVTQRAFALLERVVPQEENKEVDVIIRKVYWL